MIIVDWHAAFWASYTSTWSWVTTEGALSPLFSLCFNFMNVVFQSNVTKEQCGKKYRTYEQCGFAKPGIISNGLCELAMWPYDLRERKGKCTKSRTGQTTHEIYNFSSGNIFIIFFCHLLSWYDARFW